MRQLLRLLPLLLPLLSLVTHVKDAEAQEVTLQNQGFRINREVERKTDEAPYTISRQDCYDDDPEADDYDRIAKTGTRTWIEMSVSLTNTNASRDTVEVWASQSADCLDVNERRADGGNCHLVVAPVKANEMIKQLRVYPRVLITKQGAQNPTDASSYPDIEECDSTEKEQALILWVLLKGATKS